MDRVTHFVDATLNPKQKDNDICERFCEAENMATCKLEYLFDYYIFMHLTIIGLPLITVLKLKISFDKILGPSVFKLLSVRLTCV